jgi:hypothetical protein
MTVLKEMLGTGKELDCSAYPYLIIAITRLVCSVAQCMPEGSDRQWFLTTAADLVRETASPRQFTESLAMISLEYSVHPGDMILVKGLFSSPRLLADALGGGMRQYGGGLGLIWTATFAPNLKERVRCLAYLIRSYRSLIQYSAGAGEEVVTGLG